MVEPVLSDPNLREKAAYAHALIIIGESTHSVTPILHSNINYRMRDGTLVCLTVGFFIKIGLKNLFTQLAKVWLLYNCELFCE